MKTLVVNCGSSSIKYKLFDMAREQELASGLIERVGESGSIATHRANGASATREEPVPDYARGVALALELLATVGDPAPLGSPDEIEAVGHRVVHGGESFSASVIVDDAVLRAIEECVPLAPLHNPANLAGLRAAMSVMPGKPQVAVFDTAFFQTMPPAAYRYAVPESWYEKHRVRRYGFHGTSHRFVAGRAAEMLGVVAPNLITLHLGNGASATCIREGRAVDQSMGLTPLEGLVMGTRSGDIDPAIVFYMVSQGLSLDAVRRGLEKESGLLGLSVTSRDMRDVEGRAAEGDTKAQLAIDVFALRVRKYLGAYMAELGSADAVVFTGGIGENAARMRARIAGGLDALGIELDEARNAQRSSEARVISRDGSRVQVLVIPTNEELMIARDTMELAR